MLCKHSCGNMVEVFHFRGAQVVTVILIISECAIIMGKDFANRADSLVEREGFASDGEGQKK